MFAANRIKKKNILIIDNTWHLCHTCHIEKNCFLRQTVNCGKHKSD